MVSVVRGKKEELYITFTSYNDHHHHSTLWLSTPMLSALYMLAYLVLKKSLLESCAIPILPHHP